jgi:hypothetical protein
MKKEELDLLLEKYFSGTSTEAEEASLRSFFSSAGIPRGYETEAEMFRFMNEASSVPEPSDDLSDRIIHALDDIRKPNKIRLLKNKYYAFSGIAAGILIVIASWFFLTRSNEPADTFDDPELAYAAVVNILYDVSGRLNQGGQAIEPVALMNTGQLGKIGEFERIMDMAGRNLRSLDKLGEGIELTGYSDEK